MLPLRDRSAQAGDPQSPNIERTAMPKDFIGPSWYVSGCEFDPEWALESWRVYALQYKEQGGRRVYDGRDHSYVILDPVGNCIANIPGT